MMTLEGHFDAKGLKPALIVCRFNRYITERLLDGALDDFLRNGGGEKDALTVWVPGAFELPLAAKRLAETGKYDMVVALGAVIRGETPHFDIVANAASQGLSRVAYETGIPVGFGLLTTDTLEQAINRAGAKAGNKGAEAMATAIEMARLLENAPLQAKKR